MVQVLGGEYTRQYLTSAVRAHPRAISPASHAPYAAPIITASSNALSCTPQARTHSHTIPQTIFGRVRKEPRPGYMSTLKATAAALDALGEDEVLAASLRRTVRTLAQHLRDDYKAQLALRGCVEDRSKGHWNDAPAWKKPPLGRRGRRDGRVDKRRQPNVVIGVDAAQAAPSHGASLAFNGARQCLVLDGHEHRGLGPGC